MPVEFSKYIDQSCPEYKKRISYWSGYLDKGRVTTACPPKACPHSICTTNNPYGFPSWLNRDKDQSCAFRNEHFNGFDKEEYVRGWYKRCDAESVNRQYPYHLSQN